MSNTVKRILIGIITIPLIILIIYSGGVAFYLLILVIAGFCAWEFASLFDEHKISPYRINLVLSVLLIISAVSYFKNYALLLPVPLLIIYEIFAGANVLKRMAVFISGLFYIALPFSLVQLLSFDYRYVILLFIMIWSCDTFAYFGGKIFGKHKLSEISPKKTIEGAVAGFLFTLIASLMFKYFTGSFLTLFDSVLLGLITGVTAQAGDLFESYIKRKVNIKDSSRIIPGHGGVLDRFDSLIFSVPFFFTYIYLVKI